MRTNECTRPNHTKSFQSPPPQVEACTRRWKAGLGNTFALFKLKPVSLKQNPVGFHLEGFSCWIVPMLTRVLV